MNRASTAMVILAGLIILPGYECGPPVLDNSLFSLWCGNELCAWDVEQGKVRRVPTWHRSDHGAALDGSLVVLSQESRATSSDASCLKIELQADRDSDVSMDLELDFMADGSVEYVHPLTSDGWNRVTYHLTPPGYYDKIMFKLRKRGSGRAVVAMVKVTRGDDGSCKSPPIPLRNRPLGATCAAGAECSGGHCAVSRPWRTQTTTVSACSDCKVDSDCAAPLVCGLEPGDEDHLHRACGAAARHQLGEYCLGDAECAGGVCCGGACSQCCQGKGCPAGETCAQRGWSSLDTDFNHMYLPWQCGPGAGKGAPKATCLRDDDCASDACDGAAALRLCVYGGKRCAQDSDCAFNKCLTLGELAGVCQ